MKKILKTIQIWVEDKTGVALAEAALVLPLLMTITMGSFDIGIGLSLNQKAIRSSQMAADLLARHQTVTDADIDSSVTAARMAFEPYTIEPLGIDIVSVQFDADGNPFELWRRTENMAPDAGLVDTATGLGEEGEGALIVKVLYEYNPSFSGVIFESIVLEELAYVRGRTSSIITKEDA